MTTRAHTARMTAFVLTVAALIVAATGLFFSIGQPAHAATRTYSATHWDQATCAAFAAWERHTSPHRAAVVLHDSQLADPYLVTDVRSWFRHRHAGWSQYVRQDCTTTPDE